MPEQQVLVTGGLGAIGSFVCRELIERDVRPIVLENRIDTTLVADIKDQLEIIPGDITDLASLIRPIKQYGVRRIIHLAALMPPACQADPLLALRVNLWGAVNVFEAARLMEVERVVFMSSKAAVGPAVGEHAHPTYVPVSEDACTRPSTMYGVTKQAVEGWALQYHRSFGLDVVGFRLASTYGPGKQSRHGAVGLHSLLVESAIFGRPFRLEKGAEQGEDVIYNRDVAQGIVKGCFASTPRHQVFNLGRGEVVTMGQFAGAAQEVFPGADISVGPGVDYYGLGEWKGNYSRFDISRAQSELGFEPRFDPRSGMEDYAEIVRKLGLGFGS